MSFDLASLDQATPADKGAWCTLRHPSTGEDLPIKIKVAGEGSAVWRQQERKFQDSRLEKTHRQGKAPKILSKDLEERANKILASATMEWCTKNGEGWLPYLEVDGQQLQCNVVNAEKLYSDRRFLWLRTQVDEFAGDPVNYDPASEVEPAASLTDGIAYLGEVAKN